MQALWRSRCKGVANRLTIVGGLVTVALGACVLLAGFVPSLERAEVRRRVSQERLAAETPPVTRPLSHVVNQARGLFDVQFLPEDESAIVSALLSPAESAQLAFAGRTVSVRTANGLTPLVPGLTGAALLAIMPENSTEPAEGGMWPNDSLDGLGQAASGAGAKNALGAVITAASADFPDAEGLPLRWNTSTKSCELAPQAQRTLLDKLDRWDKQQSAYAYNLRQRAIRYQRSVEGYARKFKLQPDLVYAIMYTESSFNPDLISGRDAHGLMQIVPGTAGGEVNAWLGRSGLPSTEELLNPTVNIQYGTTYLHLLLTRHLNAIANPLSREYCAIASYNIGSSSMLKVFGPDWASAFEAINRMTPDEVRDQLTARLPARETRAFFNKVLAVRDHFSL